MVTDPFENLIQVLDPLHPKYTFAHIFVYNIRASLGPLNSCMESKFRTPAMATVFSTWYFWVLALPLVI